MVLFTDGYFLKLILKSLKFSNFAYLVFQSRHGRYVRGGRTSAAAVENPEGFLTVHRGAVSYGLPECAEVRWEQTIRKNAPFMKAFKILSSASVTHMFNHSNTGYRANITLSVICANAAQHVNSPCDYKTCIV